MSSTDQALDRLFPWFALRVRNRAEELVGSALQGKGYETFVPTYLECRRYASCVKKVNTALFPGYLFCRLDANRRLPLLTTPGVHHIVSFSGIPYPVDEEEVAAIKRVVDSKLPATPWPYLTVGNRARIESGPFLGLEGIVTTFKGRERLVLSVNLLQRSVAVEIDRSWIRPMGVAGPGALLIREGSARERLSL
jgi:transcription antitermination factor NusG